MARFYGTVRGGRTQASRLGHSNTGLYVTAQSLNGDVLIEFSADGPSTDIVKISVRPHGNFYATTLFHGPITDLLNPAARATLFSNALPALFEAL